jgi:hypothetical protein
MRSLSALEVFLLEIVVYLILWFSNDYLAVVLSLIFAGVLLVALLLALASELIERSKVPRRYFTIMVLSILAPFIVAAVFWAIQGPPDWLFR